MGPVPALLLLSLPRDVGIPPRSIPAPLRIAVHPLRCDRRRQRRLHRLAHRARHTTRPSPTGGCTTRWRRRLLLVSLLFWWPIVTPCSPRARTLSGFGKLGYIVLATIPQTFGGLLVALAGHVLYPGYGNGPQLLGFDAMTDQQIAGASIALVSKIALLGGVLRGLHEPAQHRHRWPRRRWWRRWRRRIESTSRCPASPPIRGAALARRCRRRADDRGTSRGPSTDQGAGRYRVWPGLMSAPARWLADSISETACSTLVPG